MSHPMIHQMRLSVVVVALGTFPINDNLWQTLSCPLFPVLLWNSPINTLSARPVREVEVTDQSTEASTGVYQAPALRPKLPFYRSLQALQA